MICANIQHAAGESSPGGLHEKKPSAVVVSARDESELRTIRDRLVSAGIEHVLIEESDGDYAGQAMAIGVVPQPKEKPRRVLSSLPLVR